MSSSKVESKDFSSMMYSVQEVCEKYLPEFSERGVTILKSTPLAQSVYTILKNLDYSFLGMTDFPHMLSSRVSNLEGALICAVSAVHHLFWAAIYTMIVIGTLGLSNTVAGHCREHWMIGVYGLVTTGTGLVGVLTPYYGAGLNLYFFHSVWRSLMRDYQQDLNLFERPLLSKIKTIFKQNRELIFEYVRVKFEDLRFQNEFKPYLLYTEKKLLQAEKMDNLVDLAIEFWRKFPQINPSPVPHV